MDREKILAYSEKKEHLGKPEHFLASGTIKEPGCADEVAMYLDTHREIVTSCRFTVTASACPPLKACAALAVEMAVGRPVMAAYLIDAKMLSESLGGLPPESFHCAQMAEIALKRTLQDYARRRMAALG